MSLSSQIKGEHRIFPYSFIQLVNFTIKFDELNDAQLSALDTVLVDEFNMSFSKVRLDGINLIPLVFGNSDKSEKWEIYADKLSLSLDQRSYVSYETSLKPLVNKAILIIDKIEALLTTIHLEKINLFPQAASSVLNLEEKQDLVFASEVIQEFPSDKFQTFKSSYYYLLKNKKDNYEYSTVYGGIYEEENKLQQSRYVLDINGIYKKKNIVSDSLLEIVNNLNEGIYSIFINSLSEKTINLLEEGGRS